MSGLFAWFLVSQSLTSMPEMAPGTEVRLVSPDLLTIYAAARVEDGALTFAGPLEPGQELRMLIFPPNATAEQRAAALSGAQALYARVTPNGGDIIVQFVGLDKPLSFRQWLANERGLELHVLQP